MSKYSIISVIQNIQQLPEIIIASENWRDEGELGRAMLFVHNLDPTLLRLLYKHWHRNYAAQRANLYVHSLHYLEYVLGHDHIKKCVPVMRQRAKQMVIGDSLNVAIGSNFITRDGIKVINPTKDMPKYDTYIIETHRFNKLLIPAQL